ncbi:MAG: YDG domain-containing protein, partial [Sulfuricurvum sp.]|nr:YDG domain-containing protein [Sulfuricurvum sp.]
DKNAAVGKTVTVASLTKTGTDAGNYTISNIVATDLADIIPKALTMTGTTTADKVYNGDMTSSTTVGTLSGLIGSETLSASVIGTFSDKNAAIGKTVTDAYILANGTGLASNYSLADTTSTATITPKSITVTATADDKTYDATTAATATLSSADVISGDTVTLGGTANFADKNAAVGKTVTVASLTKTGTDAGNYTISNIVATDLADIIPKAITITADSLSKIYGAQDPLLSYTQTGLLPHDTLSGLLTRAAGKLVGNYVISQGTLISDSNYALSFIPGVFSIKSDIQQYITPITNNTSAGSLPSYAVLSNAFVSDSAPQQIVEFGTNDVINIISGGVNLPVGLTQDLLLVGNTNTVDKGGNN